MPFLLPYKLALLTTRPKYAIMLNDMQFSFKYIIFCYHAALDSGILLITFPSNYMRLICLQLYRYDNVPPEINRLRCRVNYHALKFLPEIEEMADKLAARMRNRTGSLNPYM